MPPPARTARLCRRISGVDVSTQRVENAEKGDQPDPENDAENSCSPYWRVSLLRLAATNKSSAKSHITPRSSRTSHAPSATITKSRMHGTMRRCMRCLVGFGGCLDRGESAQAPDAFRVRAPA
jgi:hypothetical protein